MYLTLKGNKCFCSKSDQWPLLYLVHLLHQNLMIRCSYLVVSQVCTECIEQRLWARFAGSLRGQSQRFPTWPSLPSHHHTAISSHREGIGANANAHFGSNQGLLTIVDHPYGKIPWQKHRFALYFVFVKCDYSRVCRYEWAVMINQPWSFALDPLWKHN